MQSMWCCYVMGHAVNINRKVCQYSQCERSHNKLISLAFRLLKQTESSAVWHRRGLTRRAAFIVFHWMFSKFWKSFSSVARSPAEGNYLLRHIRTSVRPQAHGDIFGLFTETHCHLQILFKRDAVYGDRHNVGSLAVIHTMLFVRYELRL